MTENELNSLYFIEQRIKRLRYRITELNSDYGVGAINYTGMPHGTDVSRPIENIITRRDELMKQLTLIVYEKMDEEARIRRYIESVSDEEVKSIMEMRFVYLMGWFEISEELHMDRTTAAKKMRKYLREH